MKVLDSMLCKSWCVLLIIKIHQMKTKHASLFLTFIIWINWLAETVFTILHFLHNLQIGPIRLSDTLHYTRAHCYETFLVVIYRCL